MTATEDHFDYIDPPRGTGTTISVFATRWSPGSYDPDLTEYELGLRCFFR